jgi:hypothetical protein
VAQQGVRLFFFLFGNQCSAFIFTALRACVMGELGFTAFGTHRQIRRLDAVMRSSHVSFRFGRFVLGDCHVLFSFIMGMKYRKPGFIFEGGAK